MPAMKRKKVGVMIGMRAGFAIIERGAAYGDDVIAVEEPIDILVAVSERVLVPQLVGRRITTFPICLSVPRR